MNPDQQPLACSAPNPRNPRVVCEGEQGHAGMHHHHGRDTSAWWNDDTSRSAA